MKKHYNVIIGLTVLIALLAVIALAGFFANKPKAMTLQGEAEATEYRVSGKVPGRVEEIYVREGSMVHKGDTLVLIDSPEVRAKLAQASAVRDAAMAQSRKAANGARQEQITGAYQVWQQAVVQEEVMKKSFERMRRLFDQKVVSAQKYDEVKAKYDAAASQTLAAKSQYDMAVAGARQEDKDAALALVHQAEGAIQEVQGYMSELYLTAPADGIISSVYPRSGELVGQGAPVMTVTDLSDIWFTFNIREDYLHGMKIGDRINLTIPALDGKRCQAVVNYIAVRDSYATWKATKEIGQYDAKTFEVRAVPQEHIEGVLPGMTAIIEQ
ncbi:MAG: efflux RND transporter periplasmic adaptor subunit [Bacteroidales bacterium]|nr:efflux RND transporter periplasmic adaptor subunit [Candidatus Cacconaster scatequi]